MKNPRYPKLLNKLVVIDWDKNYRAEKPLRREFTENDVYIIYDRAGGVVDSGNGFLVDIYSISLEPIYLGFIPEIGITRRPRGFDETLFDGD